MAKPRNSLLDYAAYLIVRLGICLIQALTDLAAVRLVDVLGWLAYRLDGRHRRVADDNLRHAFPNLNPMERDRIVRGSFRHFISVIVETVRLPRKLHAGSLHHYVDHHSVGPFFDAV